MLSRPLAMLMLAGALAAVSVPATASARPPHQAAGACSSPTLSGPASAAVGDAYTITGCGFVPRSMVSLELTEGGGCCLAQQVYTGEDGRFTFTGTVSTTGTYRLRASELRRRGWTVVAVWSFQAS